MSTLKPRSRVNFRLLGLVLGIAVILCGGALAAHRVRKNRLVQEALAAGTQAFEAEDWNLACKQLKVYLAERPDDLPRLVQYARANLRARPMTVERVEAAVRAYRSLLQRQPGHAEAGRELARVYYKVDAFNDAAHVCRQRLKHDPLDAAASLWLARSLLASQKHDEAADILAGLVTFAPKTVKAYGLLSAIALQKSNGRNIADAKLWVDIAVTAAPESAEALVQRGRFFRVILQDAVAAEADLAAASALQSPDPSVRLTLAGEYLAMGKSDSAGGLVTSVQAISRGELEAWDIDPEDFRYHCFQVGAQLALERAQPDSCRELADQALSELSGPSRGQFLPTAVKLFLAGEDVVNARAIVEEYRDILKHSGTAGGILDVELAMADAAVADAEGRPYAVIGLLTDILSVHRQDREAWKLLALAYEQTDQPELAGDALREYVKLAPGDQSMLIKLGEHSRNRDLSQAVQYLQRAESVGAVGKASETFLLRTRITLDAVEAGLVDLAVLDGLEQAMEALAKSPATRERALVLLARIAAARGQSPDAVIYLQDAGGQGQSPNATAKLIRLYREMGEHAKAWEAAGTLVQTWPHLAFPRILNSELLIEAGNRPEAENCLRQATEDLGQDEQLTAKVALCQFLLQDGRGEEALRSLRLLAEQHPQNAKLRLALLLFPQVVRDTAGSQRLIDELRAIEGEPGLSWRIEQARHWLRLPTWRDHRSQIEQLLRHCLRAHNGWEAPALLLGEMLEQAGESAKAERVYRDSLGVASTNSVILQRLLQLFLRNERISEAAELLNSQSEKIAALRPYRVQVALAKRQYDVALELLRQEVESRPDDSPARLLLAQLEHRYGHGADAALALLADVATLSDELAAHLLSARILHQDGRTDEAQQFLQDKLASRDDVQSRLIWATFLDEIGHRAEAEQALQAATDAEPDCSESYAALAAFHARHANWDEALPAWEASIARGAIDVRVQREIAGSIATAPAAFAPRAIELFERLLALEPMDHALLLAKAEFALRSFDADERNHGRRVLEAIIQRTPAYIPAHVRLIRLALDEDLLAEAHQLTLAALGTAPGNADLLLAQAQVELARGNLSTARELLEVVRLKRPDEPQVGPILAAVALRQGRLDEAEALCAQILAGEPGNAPALLVRARLLALQGLTQAAISVLDAAADRNGALEPPLLLEAAHLQTEMGDYGKADAYLRRAEAASPSSARLSVARMQWFARQGRFAELQALLNGPLPPDTRARAALTVGLSLLATSSEEEHRKFAQSKTLQLEQQGSRGISPDRAMSRGVEPSGFPAAQDAYYYVLTSGATSVQGVELEGVTPRESPQ